MRRSSWRPRANTAVAQTATPECKTNGARGEPARLADPDRIRPDNLLKHNAFMFFGKHLIAVCAGFGHPSDITQERGGVRDRSAIGGVAQDGNERQSGAAASRGRRAGPRSRCGANRCGPTRNDSACSAGPRSGCGCNSPVPGRCTALRKAGGFPLRPVIETTGAEGTRAARGNRLMPMTWTVNSLGKTKGVVRSTLSRYAPAPRSRPVVLKTY